MQFFYLIVLVALHLIQIQAKDEIFLCNDNHPSRIKAKVGYCLRRINYPTDDSYESKMIRAWKEAGKDMIVEEADTVVGSNGFSCKNLLMFNLPVNAKACCNLSDPKTHTTFVMAGAYTNKELFVNCYPR
ncbi:hypothetical protein PCANC_20697 [Puccinia coronata f. sp. avenae]|uniref:Uncharacterized protein n=1 Tax=Puccinia coronata f. sp. avenae TaxID=200324 RepID=A0A2N5U2N5_9BASI|nr:hypothetical protein PCANC_21850 [Puccinia coronata f. sp. avenae]PLW32007.1 hypothetical protein PCANC_20697 [Puccinia coronata f. sp. avenae]